MECLQCGRQKHWFWSSLWLRFPDIRLELKDFIYVISFNTTQFKFLLYLRSNLVKWQNSSIYSFSQPAQKCNNKFKLQSWWPTPGIHQWPSTAARHLLIPYRANQTLLSTPSDACQPLVTSADPFLPWAISQVSEVGLSEAPMRQTSYLALQQSDICGWLLWFVCRWRCGAKCGLDLWVLKF